MSVTVIASDTTLTVNTSQKVVAPVGWDAQVAEYGRGYNYPQPTGQITVFRTGDDKSIEDSVFAPIRVANSLKVQNSLTDFLTLGNTNSFGNLLRFTDLNGLQVYGDDYMIDNYTGMAYNLILASGIWNSAIDSALSDTSNGFNDWFVMNVNQLHSLRDNNSADTVGVYNYVVSAAIGALTSTTEINTTRYMTAFTARRTIGNTKATTAQFIKARKHF